MALELIQVFFDGGCRPTNPGNKYGSWEVHLNGKRLHRAARFELGWGTNNEAEWESLLDALRWVKSNMVGLDPRRFEVRIFTDSMIVARRMRNVAQKGGDCRSQKMARLALDCHSALSGFYKYQTKWQRRDNNVNRFGH